MTSSHGQCTLTGYTAFAPGGGLISNVGGNSLSGKYTVSSDLYIDKDFTFDQCELRFDAGVRVVVQAGFQLTITGQSLLTSCGSSNNAMWQGIEVDGSINSVASVDINGSSVIEDAEMGINLYSGYSEIYADNAIFNRNYVHVFYDVDNVYSLPLNSYIINSSFFCKDAPSPGGTDCNCLISPHQNQRTSTCIFLNHCNASQSGASFTIGYTPSLNSQPNYFANADTGISSMMFNTLIRYNYFNTLTFGIYQRHNSWADASENVFEDCVNAIRFDDIHATDVLDNTFEFGSSGIWITRSSGNIHLSGNSINGYWQGIRIHNSLNAGNIYTTEISLNTIAYAGIRHVNYAIRVEEGALNNVQYIISGNTLNAVRRGILLRNVMNAPLISDNPVIFVESNPPQGQTYYGIQAASCTASEISNNYVYSDYENYCYDNLHGIRNNASSPSLISCNEVEFTGRDCWFGGSCPSVLFQMNAMGKARNQFYLHNVLNGLGNIGNANNPVNNSFAQSSNCSNFHGAFGFKSNQNNGFTNIYYNGSCSLYCPVNNGMQSGTNSNFNYSGVTNSNSCNPNPPDWVQDQHRIIAADTSQYAYDGIRYKWWDQYYLYRRLQQDTALLNSDTIYQQFFDTYSDSLIATLQMIGDSIAVLSYDSANQSLMTWIRDTLDNLGSAHTCAVNFIEYDKILLNFIASGSSEMDSADLAKLISIASQCPYSGGQSVFLSRSLLSLLNDTLDFDEGDCDSLYFGVRYGRGLDENDAFILFPNPATDYITIEPVEDEQATGFDLYRSNGQLLFHKTLNAGDKTVAFSKVASGLYFYCVSTAQGQRQRGKICIVRLYTRP